MDISARQEQTVLARKGLAAEMTWFSDRVSTQLNSTFGSETYD